MDAAAVGKGIAPYHGLVRLNGHVHQRTHHAAGGINLRGVDIGVDAKSFMTLHDHGNLFERSIAGTLTDTVDGHLYLTGAIEHTTHRVGRSHAKVIVAMCGENGLAR